MGFNLTYWTPIYMGGCYICMGSNLEKYGTFWKNGRFSGRIWPDWGNTAWADMAGLGSIGLMFIVVPIVPIIVGHNSMLVPIQHVGLHKITIQNSHVYAYMGMAPIP